MNKKLLDAVVANGDAYCHRYLAQYSVTGLENNWWIALDFFLGRACFQGRRDDVSIRVYESAREILAPLFATDQAEENFSRVGRVERFL